MKPKIPGGRSFDYRALNQQQLAIGTAVELEHTSRRDVAREIAAAHLQEDPDYYTKLRRMERGHCNPGPRSKKHVVRCARTRTKRTRSKLQRCPATWQENTPAKWQEWLKQNGFPTRDEVTANISNIIENRGTQGQQHTYTELLVNLAGAGMFYDIFYDYFVERLPFPRYFAFYEQTVTARDLLLAYLSVLDDLYSGRPVQYIDRVSDYERLGKQDSKPNPSPGVSEEVIFAYKRFHGVQPDSFTDQTHAWVPGELVEAGRGVDTGYGITDRRSNKDGWYVHDFGPEVLVYRRAQTGDVPDIVWENFPKELWILGFNLGFTYEDPTGKRHEVKASHMKKLATNDAGDLLAVIGPSGVEYILKGGRMRVEDWIRD